MRTTWDVEPDRLKLDGDVRAGVSPVTVWFQWGRSPTGDDFVDTPHTTLGDGGSVQQAFSQEVTGLDPSTMYRYRAVASNALATTYGSIQQSRTRWVGLPDYYIQFWADVPGAQVVAGAAHTFAYCFCNGGPGMAEHGSMAYVQFYLSSDEVFGDDDPSLGGTFVWADDLPDLCSILSITVTIPAGTAPGDYFYVGRVKSAPSQSNTDNDIVFVPIKVIAPPDD